MTSRLRGIANNFTDAIFPVNADDVQKFRLQRNRTGYEYVSNLPLQMALYFNVCFFPVWLIGFIICISAEFSYMSNIYQVINAAVFGVFCILEIVRLYLGFIGNLSEQSAELAGFFLISLINLAAILFLLIDYNMILSGFERLLHAIELGFVALELILSLFTLKMLVDSNALKFHMHMEHQQREVAQFSGANYLVDPNNTVHVGYSNEAYTGSTTRLRGTASTA